MISVCDFKDFKAAEKDAQFALSEKNFWCAVSVAVRLKCSVSQEHVSVFFVRELSGQKMRYSVSTCDAVITQSTPLVICFLAIFDLVSAPNSVLGARSILDLDSLKFHSRKTKS